MTSNVSPGPTWPAGVDRADQPVVINHQRAAALRFGDPRVQALLSVLVVFRLLPTGFSNRDLRAHLAPLLGLARHHDRGQMTYDLRRLRLHGLIARIEGTHRYTVTDHGLRLAVYLTRVHRHLSATGSQTSSTSTLSRRRHAGPLDRFSAAVDRNIHEHRLIA